MEKVIIVNHSQLIQRLAELRMYKDIRENELKVSFTEMASTLNLTTIFKEAKNINRPMELAKSGINMLVDLIIDLVLGKHRSVKGYLSAVMLEKISAMLVDNNLINIIYGINSIFKRKSQYEKSQEEEESSVN